MMHPGRIIYLLLLSASLVRPLGIGPSVFAAEKPGNQIQVTLFGQPCLLQGPIDLNSLKAIHSVSPEQIYPPYSPEDSARTTATQLKKAVTNLRAASKTPSVLDRYRERLLKRLEAQLAFFECVSSAKKGTRSEGLKVAAQKHFQTQGIKSFEAAVKRFDASKSASLEPLFELYNDNIEPDPEDEFHRATRRIKVNYNCAFESADEEDEE